MTEDNFQNVLKIQKKYLNASHSVIQHENRPYGPTCPPAFICKRFMSQILF